MRKPAQFIFASAAVLIVLGVSAWSLPQEPKPHPDKRHEHIEPSAKNQSDSRNLQERQEVKQIIDEFYASIADADRIHDYQDLIEYLNTEDSLPASERIHMAKEFFAPEMMLFDPISVSEDKLFSILSIAMVASQEAGYPEATVVPLEAISVTDDTAMVDLSMVDIKTQDTKASGYIELEHRDGQWLISSIPGIE